MHRDRSALVPVALAVLLAPPVSAAGAEPGGPATYTYKTVGDCAIQADVYAPAGDAPRPVVVWIHGGALITGHRSSTDRVWRDMLLAAGFAVVSIDYRLAPETKAPAIIEDVQAACAWVRRDGPRLFRADPARLAVAGGSAGGYLTLAAGHRVEPRPRALVSFWGYGDVAGAWYSQPDPFYAKQPPVPKDEAYAAVGGPVLTGVTGRHTRGRFYLYCRQHGLWPREVTGFDPAAEPRAFDPLCPVRNVTPAYPPTLLIHGTKDTDVPYEQSVLMAKELARHGVAHEFITIRDGGHGFGGVKPEVVADARQRALAFLQKHTAPAAGRPQ